ncbi:MAG: zinc-binding dehydrogenase [Acidimicrobiia bacterium]|nr:zinc-binding dehydrogenase [Acidimicrobiia bacterium]
MKQVVQPASGGRVRVLDVPRPVAGPTEVLVRTAASLVSAGTERAVTELARSSLLAKAKARPDLVRQVARKAQSEGARKAFDAVRARLGTDIPLGYSAAGVAVEVGSHVHGVQVSDLVATGGAGKANHAEYQAVPALLCSKVAPGVTAADAAFSTCASVALHGLRLGGMEPGSKVVVVGLGLMGQLAVRLARAAGCDVAGIDVADMPLDVASRSGALALAEHGAATTAAVMDWSRGRGADIVLVAAADPSSQIMERAPGLCRDRASVVVVGDVGVHIDRRPFYEKELSVRFARSFGPGRHERSYEEWGVDLPAGFVRWTEGRNLETVLDLLASGRLVVEDLVTHRFAIGDAAAAYDLIGSGAEPYLGVQLTYPADHQGTPGPIRLRGPSAPSGEPGVGLIGAGAFASSVLVPALRDAGFSRFVAAGSASGLSARRLGERMGFETAVPGDQVVDAPGVDVVVVATAHDTHAVLAARALRAGKAVWCEKPLALSQDELDEVRSALDEGPGLLFVGYNRRWSPAVEQVREHFGAGAGPLVVTYRVSAGPVAEGHWYADRRQGGRLLGEVCHFVDTCAAIAGPVVDARALGSGEPELLLSGDVAVVLRHRDGSLSTISYASGGPPGYDKERIEVLGRGRSAVVADFRQVTLDGERTELRRQDKGHAAMARAFRAAVLDRSPLVVGLDSTAAVLRAAASLGSPGTAP